MSYTITVQLNSYEVEAEGLKVNFKSLNIKGEGLAECDFLGGR